MYGEHFVNKKFAITMYEKTLFDLFRTLYRGFLKPCSLSKLLQLHIYLLLILIFTPCNATNSKRYRNTNQMYINNANGKLNILREKQSRSELNA